MAFQQVFENPIFGDNDTLGPNLPLFKAKKRQGPKPPVQFVNVQSLSDVGSAKYNQLVRSHVMKVNRAQGRRSMAAKALKQMTCPETTPLLGPLAGLATAPRITAGPTVMGDLYAAFPADGMVLLETFETWVAPYQLPFHATDGQMHPYVRHFVAAAVESEVLLQAILFASLINSQHLERDASFHKRVDNHRKKAINLLLGGFADPQRGTSDEAIAAVSLIATYDLMLSGDVEANDAHMRGLYKMTAQRGGLESLGMQGLLKTAILWGDSYQAIYYRQRPHYAVPPRPEHEPRTPLQESCYYATRKMWRQGLIGPELVEVCEELNSIFQRLTQIAKGLEKQAAVEDLLEQRKRLESKLLPVLKRGTGAIGSLEHVVSAGMRLYTAVVLSRMPFSLSEEEGARVPILARELRDSIVEDRLDQEWAQCAGFLLWIFFAGAFLDEDSDVRAWLMKEGQPIIMRLHVAKETFQRTKFSVTGYIWSDEFCDAQAEAYWQLAQRKAMNRRQD